MAEQQIRDANGTAQVAQIGTKADVTVGTLATNASNITSSSIIGYVGAYVYVTGGNIAAATLAFSLSLDGGSTFPVSVMAERLDYPAAHDSTFTVLSGNPCGFAFWVPLPSAASTSIGVQLKVASTAGTFTSAPTVTIIPSVSAPVSRSNSRTVNGPVTTSANGVLLFDLLSGTTATTATSGVSGWFDAGAYIGKYANISVNTAASTTGAWTAEYTNDPTVDTGLAYKAWNLIDPSVTTMAAPGNTQTLAASTSYSRAGQVPARFIRLRLTTAVGAGSAQATIAFSDASPVQQGLQIMGQGAAGQTVVYPVVTGGIVRTTQPTATADQKSMQFLLSKTGQMIASIGTVREFQNTLKAVTVSTTTETTLIAAVATYFQDIYGLTVSNTSITTATRVDIRDTTAGTVVESFWLPAATTLRLNYDVPLKQSAINTNWTVQLSVATTDVRISACYTINL